jgi:hypothetical protein
MVGIAAYLLKFVAYAFQILIFLYFNRLFLSTRYLSLVLPIHLIILCMMMTQLNQNRNQSAKINTINKVEDNHGELYI